MKQIMTMFIMLLASTTILAACGGGGGGSSGGGSSGGGGAAPTWSGTKQLGTASATVSANGVAVDSEGNVYVVGHTTAGLDGNALMGTWDFFLTMYDASGNRVRTKQLGVAMAYTYANSVAVDSNNNVYVTCWTTGGLDGNARGGYRDVFLTMYDSSGNKVRTRQFSLAGGTTSANNVAVDSRGNVLLAGYATPGWNGSMQDGIIAKYDSSGIGIYIKQFGASSVYTTALGVAVDSSGNIFAVGTTEGGLDGNTLVGTNDGFLTMYDSSGNKVRTIQFGVSGRVTSASRVALDSSGNVYVTGATNGGLDGNTCIGMGDAFLIKYDSSGKKIYTKQFGVASAATSATGIVVDPNGNVYVVGYTDGSLDGNTLMGTNDFFLTRFTSTGNKVWTKQLGVTGKSTIGGNVAVDSSGNVYVTGWTTGGLDGNTLKGVQDLFITKYDSAGNKQ